MKKAIALQALIKNTNLIEILKLLEKNEGLDSETAKELQNCL